MKNIIRVSAFLLAIMPALSFGQCCPYIDGIEVHPPSPTTNDNVTIVYTVTTPNQGAYLGETHTLSGDTVVINACYYNGMLTALQTYTDSITVAPLPQGNHFVRLHASISDDMTQCVPTQFQDSVFSFSVAQGGPMPICDSVFVSPDTVYVNQSTDTSVTVSVTYTGQGDVSYSSIDFVFNDSAYLDINDFAVTNGIAGPYTFTWHYDLMYNQTAIPANTVVNAGVHIFHGGLNGPTIDCTLPITFILNQPLGIQPVPEPFVATYPNPVSDLLTVKGTGELVILDAVGRPVLAKQAVDGITRLDVRDFAAGLYVAVIENQNGVAVRRFCKQ